MTVLTPKSMPLDIAGLIHESGVGSDYVHALYGDSALDDIATSFDLNTVREEDIARAQQAIKSQSQTWMQKKTSVRVPILRIGA